MTAQGRSLLVLELFERYYDRVYRFARQSVDASAAEDIAQEVFTRLLKAEGLETKTIQSSYLVKIADNLIKRRYQQARRRERLVEERQRERRAEWNLEPSGLARVEEEEDRRHYAARTRTLNDNEHAALRFIVAGGMSYRAAASSLGVNVTAVNNWKFRGIQRLRKDGFGRDIDQRADHRTDDRTGHGADAGRARSAVG